jgi:hypothetical protein
LFQEFSFEVIIKPGRCNAGPDHLSKLELGESGRAVDDKLPDANLFRVEAILEYLEDITVFLSTGACPEMYSTTQKRHRVFRAVDYQLIAWKLYKLGLDSILKRCVLDHERQDIPWECHNGVVEGHVGRRPLRRKSSKLDYGGPHSSRMKRCMLNLAMLVKEWVSHHDEMNFLFI